jgi:hypothetical protein
MKVAKVQQVLELIKTLF